MRNPLRQYSSGAAALAILVIQACATGSTGVAPSPASCLVSADSTAIPLDTVVVALSQTDGSFFTLHQLSSTLVRRDCEGQLHPDLATQWRAEDGGKSWVFTLKKVTAGLVRDTWEQQRNGGVWLWPAILEVEVLDSSRLRVRLDRTYRELPTEFTAVPMSVPVSSHRLAFVASPTAGPVTRIEILNPVKRGEPVIKVEVLRPSVDPRDAMDFPRVRYLSPADIVVTSDAATIAYARTRPEFAVVPVAWFRTYVLLTPIPDLPATPLSISEETRLGLIRDVVPGEVRRASPPFWWDSLPCLSTTRAYDPGPRAVPVLAFDGTDAVARSLAERLAALTVSHPRTMALSPLRLSIELFTGTANAFVMSFPRPGPANCDAITRWPRSSRIDPLVDLQAYVIVRRGVPPLLLDDDGMIRFNPATGP